MPDIAASKEEVGRQPALPRPENKLFYPALDGLRAVAALLVFFYHYFSGKHVPEVLQFGWFGVDVFFVLSGFLITGILFDSRNTVDRFKIFYARRSLRIFPLYYGVFAFLLITTPLLHWQWRHSMLYWPLYLGNLFQSDPNHALLFSPILGHTLDFGHFWSLCVEEQFYLLWPFVVFTVRDRVRLRNLCLGVVVLAPVLRLVASLLMSPAMRYERILYFATPFRVDGLLLGGALALMLRGPEAERIRRLAIPGLVTAAGLLIVCWIFAVRVLHQPAGMHVPPSWVETVGFTLFDLISASALLMALRPGNLVYRACMIEPLRRLGKISYGFYIFHVLPYDWYMAAGYRICTGRFAGLHAIATGAIALLCTIVIAGLSFRFVETPFLRLKSRFSVRVAGETTTVRA